MKQPGECLAICHQGKTSTCHVLFKVFDSPQNSHVFSFCGAPTRVCFRKAVASEGEDSLLASHML